MSLEHELVAAALPGYEVGGELGRGGWGVVLEGRHRQLGRAVAIKQLPRGFAADPGVRARFLSEARLLASLDHPHIVPIYDYVERDGLCVLVMERLPGGTVWSRFTSQGLSMQTACAVVLAACSGLQCAHEHDVLHRDVKPENLMFSATGSLKVTDFGIAKVVGGSETLATKAGEVIGTPAYMAPEQAQGEELSPATDVYAVGTMLYELLSGRLPFPEQGTAMATLYRHVHELPEPVLAVAPGVPATLATVVMRAIATNPADRYQSAEDMGVALAEAAGEVWGPAWLTDAGMPVLAAGRIASASSGLGTAPPEAAPSSPAAGPETISPWSPGEPPRTTIAPGAPPPTIAPGAGAGAPPPTIGPSPTAPLPPAARPAPATIGPTVPLQAVARAHGGKAALVDLQVADLVPVQRVVTPRSNALVPALAAVGLLVAAVTIALTGVTSPSRSGGLTLTVNGADPVAAPPTVDLSKRIHLAGPLPPEAGDADRVKLSFSVLGISLGQAHAALTRTPNGQFAADVDASGSRYLAAGRVTARAALSAGSTDRSFRSFAITSKQPAIATAPGGAAVFLLLFVLASAESVLRSLRRGQRAVTGTVSMALVGGVLGLGAVIAAWLTAIREPTPSAAIVSAALGAAAGIAVAIASRRRGRARRARR